MVESRAGWIVIITTPHYADGRAWLAEHPETMLMEPPRPMLYTGLILFKFRDESDAALFRSLFGMV